MLDLPIPNKKGTITLHDCLEEYCKEEYLTGNNSWYNEENKNETRCVEMHIVL